MTSFCKEFCSRRNKCLVNVISDILAILGIIVGMIVVLAIIFVVGWFLCEYIIYPIINDRGVGFWENSGFYFLFGSALFLTIAILGYIIYGIVLLSKCVYSSCKDACKDAKLRSEMYSTDLYDTNTKDNEEPLEINVEE